MNVIQKVCSFATQIFNDAVQSVSLTKSYSHPRLIAAQREKQRRNKIVNRRGAVALRNQKYGVHWVKEL